MFSITHTDPYITPEGISRTIELYWRDSNLAELGLASVGYSTRGAGLIYGLPITEYDRIFLGLRYEGTTIDLTAASPPRLHPVRSGLRGLLRCPRAHRRLVE